MKSVNALKIALGVLALVIAWAGFQLGTHRHTGILRTLVGIRQFVGNIGSSSDSQHAKANASPGNPHSVRLSWNASTSAVVGYNVYRRDASGTVKVNSDRVVGTSFDDPSVQSGQSYFYVVKAVNSSGKESVPSNEVHVVIPP